MNLVTAPVSGRPSVRVGELVMPREHGSWSLALEPIALGLLVAPSLAGALLAVALIAGFLARRPLKIAFADHRPVRRAAARNILLGCGTAAAFALAAVVRIAGADWWPWLLPTIVGAVIFARFDRLGAGREEAAEITGAAAFAIVPAALGLLGGLGWPAAAALALLSLGRSMSAVLTIRAYLRATKTGRRRDVPPLIAGGAAVLTGCALVHAGIAPVFAAIAMLAFAGRTVVLLVLRPGWRARTVGTIEALMGTAFIIGMALAWPA